MNQDYVTRLVVGPSIFVALGQPVVATGLGKDGLRLEGPHWIPAGSKLPASVGMPPIDHVRPWRNILAGRASEFGAAGVALALIAATCAVLFWPEMPATRPEAHTLPIAPAPAAPAAVVTMVPAPHNPALRLSKADSPAGQSGSVHLEGHAPAHAMAPSVVPALARAPTRSDEGPTRTKPLPPGAPARSDKEKVSQDKVVKAVIMDDVPPTKASQIPAPQAPAPQPTSKAPASAAAMPVAVAAPTASAKPAQPRGTGLLAIAPDGKSAAFTNPKTGLPDQFQIGDQLPNGETVRSIDLKEGRVVTNAKEYGLE